MNRRKFLKLLSVSASGVGIRESTAHTASGNIQSQSSKSSGDNSSHKDALTEPRIDRHTLVTRHNIVLTSSDVMSPLSVGNGEFAFTADVTGLQTFEADHNAGIFLSTMSQWGFHSMPNPQVLLAFAWTREVNAPVLLGQVNFFQEFEVCFYRAKSTFEIATRLIP